MVRSAERLFSRQQPLPEAHLVLRLDQARQLIPAGIPELERRRDLVAKQVLNELREAQANKPQGTVYVSASYEQRQTEIAQEVQLFKEVTTLGNMGRSVLEIADHIRGRRTRPNGATHADKHLLAAHR